MCSVSDADGPASATRTDFDLILRVLATRSGADAVVLALARPDDRAVLFRSDAGESARAAMTSPANAGFVGDVITSGCTLSVTLSSHNDLVGVAAGILDGRATLTRGIGTGVRAPGHAPGALCLGFRSGPAPDDEATLRRLLERYAALIALCLADSGLLEGRLGAGRFDPVTGCLTHAAVRVELDRELALSARGDGPLACCFVDLDDLTALGETHGQRYARQVLADVARLLTHELRPGDVLGRYDRDRLLIVLPGAGERAAVALAQHLRRVISPITIGHTGRGLSASFGVAAATPGWRADELLAAAGSALLRAKRTGGGSIVSCGPALPERARAALHLVPAPARWPPPRRPTD